MTDLNTIYACNKWELEAILEGLHYRALDEQERLAELAVNLRYTLNAKTIKLSKLTKNQQRQQVRQVFAGQSATASAGGDNELLRRIERLNAHFQGKRG